jgi:hypothetical protein
LILNLSFAGGRITLGIELETPRILTALLNVAAHFPLHENGLTKRSSMLPSPYDRLVIAVAP